MGDKKEEQIKIIEMMNDARKDLEAKYARLKAQLGEEEIEEADETISEDVVDGAAVESSPAESDQPTEEMSDNTSDNKVVKKVPKKTEKKVENLKRLYKLGRFDARNKMEEILEYVKG